MRPTRPIVVGPLSEATRTVTSGASASTVTGDTLGVAGSAGSAAQPGRAARPSRTLAVRPASRLMSLPLGGDRRRGLRPERCVGGVQQVVREVGAGLPVVLVVQAEHVG